MSLFSLVWLPTTKVRRVLNLIITEPNMFALHAFDLCVNLDIGCAHTLVIELLTNELIKK